MRFNGVTSRRTKSLVWGSFFALVIGGCATGIVANPDDGGDLGDAPASAMDSGGDGGAVDTGKVDTGKTDAGHPDSGVCGDWAGPTAASTCTDMCNDAGHICGPNGCYNMWWCRISTGVCAATPPSGC